MRATFATTSRLPVVRVFVGWGPARTARVVAAIFFGLALVWAFLALWPGNATGLSWIPDTQFYYGAGERLNVGHELYRYLPGDRHLSVDNFSSFAGPFLYPPLLGVLWRPLALLPFEPVVFVWWIAGAATLIATTYALIQRGGAATAAVVVLLCVPLSLTTWSGNVQAFLTPAVIASWYLLPRHERLAGAVLGVATVMKLTPVFLCLWLLTTGRRQGALAASLSGIVALVVSIVGAGLASYVDYAHVAATVVSVGGTEASLTGIARAFGVSEGVRALMTPVVVCAATIAVVLLRRRPRIAWAVAAVAGVLASTVMNLTNVTLLLAGIVPWATRRRATIQGSWTSGAAQSAP